YPSDLQSFARSRLPGPWDSRRSGKRMKLQLPESWERELSLHGNRAEVWERLIGTGSWWGRGGKGYGVRGPGLARRAPASVRFSTPQPAPFPPFSVYRLGVALRRPSPQVVPAPSTGNTRLVTRHSDGACPPSPLPLPPHVANLGVLAQLEHREGLQGRGWRGGSVR
ncbi:hypothetical protein chiPu_0030127, partial [Chiloscyllium punctatum]|nr:hypothetical protein [Chiloscyllium punctatum]